MSPVQVKDKLDQVSSLTVRKVLQFQNNKSSIWLWCALLSPSSILETVNISDIYPNSSILSLSKIFSN